MVSEVRAKIFPLNQEEPGVSGRYLKLSLFRASPPPHHSGPKSPPQCTRSQSGRLSFSNTCREQAREPGRIVGFLAEIPLQLPHDQITGSQSVFPWNFFPVDAKNPHKSMIYRASSINMAPDVGIEPATH